MAAGESPVKQAARRVDEPVRQRLDASRVQLVGDASRRFDLSPLDEDFLMRHLAERAGPARA